MNNFDLEYTSNNQIIFMDINYYKYNLPDSNKYLIIYKFILNRYIFYKFFK